MIWRNNKERYGLIAASLHWLIALLVIVMLGLGLYMTAQKPSPLLFKLYFYHKSLGITVLFLTSLRLGWRFLNLTPLALPSHAQWERILAKTSHFLLYLALLALPLSGWLMSSAKGFSVSVFGWFTLPDLVSESKILADRAVAFHVIVAYSLIGIVSLHIAGALKHHFWDRDVTLRRMIPGTKLALAVFAGAVLFASIPTAAETASEGPAPAWQIDPAQSSIAFEALQMGAPFTGKFEKFDGEIFFDPADLAQSRVRVWVDTASVTTKSADRDQYLPMPEWLAVEAFPQAELVAHKFSQTGKNSYIAHGTLTLKNTAHPVDVPFNLTFSKIERNRQKAEMAAEFKLHRLAYNIGEGEWEDTSMVGDLVTVTVKLTAYEKSAKVPEIKNNSLNPLPDMK